MKRAVKVVALALGSVMLAATFAACGGGGGDEGTSSENGIICFDNLGGDTSYIADKATKFSVKGAKNIKGYVYEDDYWGEVDDYNEIATYSADTFTAVSAGRITYTVGNKLYTLDVAPAYATDPGNQYAGNVNDFNLERGDAVLGNTHDPSFIESADEFGNPLYYLFSTGWGTGNDVHISYDGMLTWEYLGKTTQANDYTDETIFPEELKDWMNSRNNGGDIQWWAPDIVPAEGGGYWLYTCLVMADSRMPYLTGSDSKLTPNDTYSRACIVMYHISDLNNIGQTGAVEYKGVLMQSAIPQGQGRGAVDVNAIDPQIIYTPAGEMYMAYGSFGTGNWMIELNPKTGLRKDGVNDWKDWEWVRRQRNFVVSGNEETGTYPSQEQANTTECGKKFLSGEAYIHDYYGRMISVGAMEAPIIARHDNVKIFDETTENPDAVEGKTYYYSMHSYNWLAGDYQMWGGRSESVMGAYLSAGGGYVYNYGVGGANQGNKYMGGFRWQNNTGKEYACCLPGHNDLYTTDSGIHVAAYINRNYTNTDQFLVQVHQYYLNSKGDICINPNRYGGEVNRGVSEEELFALTDGSFEMVVLTNQKDWNTGTIYNVSRTVTLDKATHEIKEGNAKIGTWVMYGDGYIKFTFDQTLKGSGSYDSGETVYYGVVRPAWLTNLNKSGFTVSCLGNTSGNKQSMAMFMNSRFAVELA